ncbi:MAG TPA: methyltransferase [Candidatus Binataceae bacterium]|nr:methyltransferase [Candidatus Binataceae bacterium]
MKGEPSLARWRKERAGVGAAAGFAHVRPIITLRGLWLAAGNAAIALMFFTALAPNALRFGGGVANQVWLAGAVVMGCLSLIRVAPVRVSADIGSLIATGGALMAGAMIRVGPASAGMAGSAAIAIEIAGIAISQVSRIYLGRSFGLLPANRGIVSKGPFRLVRHPVYLGWFILISGFTLAFPTLRNFACLASSIPFIAWRIVLEEALLSEDPAYRRYRAAVRYRLIPGLI